MIYKFGILLLIGTYLPIYFTAAQQRCACPRDLEPVCGSDGRTYNNECLLKCAQASNSSLTVRTLYACGSPPPKCSCKSENKPVCGSDGKTYPNECSFRCEQASHPDLSIRSRGKCRKKRAVVDQKCDCSKEIEPMRGTDGVNYYNPCFLECAAKDPTFTTSKPGPTLSN